MVNSLLSFLKKFSPDTAVVHRVSTNESAKNFLQSQPQKYWEESDFVIDYAFKHNIEVSFRPPNEMNSVLKKMYLSTDFPNAIEYSTNKDFASFTKMVYMEGNLAQQPLIMAPYPIGKDDINKINLIAHDSTNTSETARILEMIKKHAKVFAQTGNAHFAKYKNELAKILKNDLNMLEISIEEFKNSETK